MGFLSNLFGTKEPELDYAHVRKTLKELRSSTTMGGMVRAGEAYGKLIRNPGALELIIQALEDEDSDVRCKAADALGEMGDARAIEFLVKAWQDEDSDVRQAVTTALEKIVGTVQ